MLICHTPTSQVTLQCMGYANLILDIVKCVHQIYGNTIKSRQENL